MKSGLKKLLAVIIIVTVGLTSVPVRSYATQATKDKVNQAQKDKDAAEKEVDSAKGEVNSLSKRKKQLNNELNNLNEELQQITDRITDLETQIADKEEEIRITEDELATARQIESDQYAAMKKRIQFMYEDSESLYLDIIFNAKSFSDFLTLNDYVNNLAAYDRKQLNIYNETRVGIEELEAKLNGEKADLDVLKAEAKEEQSQVMVVIENTSQKVSEYSDLLDDAEEELKAKEKELEDAKNNLATLQKQLEEEIRLSQLAQRSAWRDISEVHFEEGDRYLLAVLIYCEAGGEPYEGKLAVGAVVINRVLSSVYPNTVSGVIYQKYQFSPVGSGRLGQYLAIGKTNDACYRAADAAMSGQTNVGNCLYFRTPIPGLTGIQIGNHIFY